MKRWLQLLFLSFFFITFAQNETDEGNLPDAPEKERIISFYSDIEVDKNSGITVTEHIKAYTQGNMIKRGIFRSLPLSRNLNNRKHKVKYDIISVKKNGADENYHEKIVNDYLEIYFGNENVILDPGAYDYEIKYRAKNQIGFFDRYDELYWNVNGTFWDFDVDSISARVTLPEGAGILQNSCYTGAYGSTAQNCTAKILSDNSIEWSASGLKANEGLTVAVGFKKGIMIPPPPPTFLELYGILIGGFIIFIGLIFYYYTTWRKYGVDPEKPTIYPQFNIPENMSPATLGYIKSESFSNKYLTAAIVDLAVKGYIKIIEGEESGVLGFFNRKTFTLKKLKEADETLPKEEINLMNSLFSEYKDAVTFDGKYDSKIEKAVLNFKETLKFQHDSFLNEGSNTSKLLFPWLAATLVYGLGLCLSYMIYPEIEKVLIGGVIYIVLFVLFIIAFLMKKKFFWIFLILIPFNMLFGVSMLIYKGYDAVESNNFNVCYIFLVLVFVSLIIYQYLIKRPSEEKLRKKSLIDGFKMYMGAAENEQLKFHNPPQMTPQVFESLLPFAMVLGVDEIWGKKFDEVLKQTAADYQNSWYYGGTMNHYAFASTLNSSLTQSIQSTSTQPSSSGSGSGGGGFSGGGGGGGGGGGW